MQMRIGEEEKEVIRKVWGGERKGGRKRRRFRRQR
jgi:hypothetical protein